MSQLLIVVDHTEDWSPFYPSDQVITFEQYLHHQAFDNSAQRVRVINLCRDYSYLSDGYYCSLLSEARHHHVIPSIRTLNDLATPLLYQLQLGNLADRINKVAAKTASQDEIHLLSFFGNTDNPAFQTLGRFLFERLPCPILEIIIEHKHGNWEISELKPRHHLSLDDNQQNAFANALEAFSSRVWASRRSGKHSRYDMAILANADEKLPPSDKTALNKFIQAGKKLGVRVEIIGQQDYMRLAEFDALFIRETTAIDHHSYRFAQKAETLGLVVMDDPTSILRCTNKVYLADLFATHKVPSPATRILRRQQPEQLDSLIEQLGLPMVIKIPDGSFSRGVVKSKTRDELARSLEELFSQSSLLLAQEYIYTDYDWRIGVLNNKALFACRYYMVKNHWQIYRHGANRTASGRFETLPVNEAPKAVLQAALKATRLIGDGFYGVDVKERDGKACVIEVNDNPNIDSRIEDAWLGSELYLQIMQEFVRRIEQSKQPRPGHTRNA